MSRFKYIRADVYRRGITIFIGPKKDLPTFVKKAFKGNKTLLESIKDSLKEDSLGTTYHEDFGQSLIWIPKWPKTPKELGTLAHEILHATMNMLDYIDVEYRYGGPNEPYTYLFEFLFTEALEEKGYEKVE